MNNILYNASNIKVLKGLEAVIKRPGMYIGDTDNGQGLHQMVYELIDNSIDEALAGYCNTIQVNIYKDNSISVKDNGRGIPIDIHKEEGKIAAEIIMTVLHSGAKFDNESYKISGGLHGVGLSVVNALSEKIYLQIFRNNKIYFQKYFYSIPSKPKIFNRYFKKNNLHGTLIRFWPNKNIFNNIKNFDFSLISTRLKQLSFLNKEIKIIIHNKILNINKIYSYKGGITEYLIYLNNKYNIVNKKIFYFNITKNDINIELAMQWNDSGKENILCFTNNIYQKDGGVHLSGLKNSITRAINRYLLNKNIYKNISIIGEDTRYGLTAILVIKMIDPKFSSQTKDKLVSSEIRTIIESIVYENFNIYLSSNIEDTKLIINQIISVSKNREDIIKKKELNKKQSIIDNMNLCGKLSDCQVNNPNLSELFLVEGDSAGGSAKQARDRRYQAILPLKGKILNVEKVSYSKMLCSQEIINLIVALRCGINNKKFNLNRLKYHRIIIMTDADIDGLHIRTLLLTFFYKYIPDLLKKGYIYIAQPPLYKIKFGNNIKYLDNENKFKEYITNLLINNTSFIIKNNDNIKFINKQKIKKIILQYYKIYDLINKLKLVYPKKFLQLLTFYNKNINFTNYNNFVNFINEFIYTLNKYNIDYYYKYEIFYKEKNFYKGFYLIEKKFNFINNKIFIKKNFFYNKNYKILTSLKLYFNLIFNKHNLIYIKYNLKDKMYNKIYPIYNFQDIINFINKYFLPKIHIQRYKGLGEMNPLQLWETTMNPKKRRIIKISYEESEKVNYLFSQLMGQNVSLRKEFINKSYFFIKNLDI